MTILGLILSVIYTLAGASAFVALLILGNYPSAVWAVATGIISAITTHLRWLKFRNHLDEWYSARELSPLSLVGFICFTLGVMGVVYHTAIEIMLKKPILPIDQSEIIAIIWAFLTAKSGILLMYTARSYSSSIDTEERSDLVSSQVENQQEEEPAEPIVTVASVTD